MIRDSIRKLLNLPDAIIEHPENTSFGDYSTNAVLKLAKNEGKNPMELAQAIAQKLLVSDTNMFVKIEVASPGFINFTLSAEFLRDQVAEILSVKEKYGALDFGQNKKVQVEFISANPTGPLTMGNGRGGFFGDALANVLESQGHKVTREFYINDRGGQILALGRSIKLAQKGSPTSGDLEVELQLAKAEREELRNLEYQFNESLYLVCQRNSLNNTIIHGAVLPSD